ncbi:MAG: molybdate ABC transporter substrate-binding protein, partial [Oscillospiraceae bacterium]|nr:molybdate ABC transporter substrate-binding protein [Oscillospiraceae bacterium]
MKTKKLLALLLALAMMFALAACGSSSSTTTTTDTDAEAVENEAPETPAEEEATENAADETADAEPVELIVFAAASMTETLNEIATLYAEEAPNVTLVFNFDSSGTLKTQIEEGADVDLFISAAPKQMYLFYFTADTEFNTDGLDFVLEGSRINLLENKVALAVPDDNTKGITSYDDLAAGLTDGSVMLAMGNSDVPVGQYTQKILAYYGLDEETLANAGVITYGSNVKEVTTQVSEATVDCGIIYATDAFSANLEVVDTATAEMCGQVIYPAAVMNVSTQQDEAQEYLAIL